MKKKHTQPRDKAVALKYLAAEDAAPKVVAKGEGFVAAAIKEKARQYGIPIHRDDTLLELLAQVDIDRAVPPELYASIAEILSWIYRANDQIKKEMAA
ncbi:MAG TPA: EscU/YscU/HrcU family type III secretion system export apparatus switch protein [Chitinivibrionales bacterium]